MGYLCTCARADRASVSQERLGRLSSILVCELGGQELGAYHKSWMGYLCTFARAHRASESQKRLDRLCSNLVCVLRVAKYVLSTSQGQGVASLHVRTRTPISVSQDPSGQLC